MKRFNTLRFVWVWAVVGAIGIIVLTVPMAWSIREKSKFYVINTDPPSVAVIDGQSLKTVGSVPLDSNPSYAVIGPQNRYLYVLHNGLLNPSGKLPKVASELSILDTSSRKLVKKIPVGWYASKLSFSEDDRYLLCFSRGRSGKKKVESVPASVTVINTATNSVEADLSAGRRGKQILFTRDASKIFVLTSSEEPNQKDTTPGVKPGLTVFSLDSETPLASIDLPREPTAMVLSGDQKWLYIVDQGVFSRKKKKRRDAMVSVFDVASLKLVGQHDVGCDVAIIVDDDSSTATIVSHVKWGDPLGQLYQLRGDELKQVGKTGKVPMYLRRFGPRHGVYVLGWEEMQFLSDDGVLDSSFVSLNAKKSNKGNGEAANKLGGFPGETLYIPGKNEVLLTVLKYNYKVGLVPTSKVAIVGLNDNQVEHIVTTGRGGVKFAKRLGALALSAGLTYMSYSAAYSMAQSTGSSYFFYNVYAYKTGPPNLSLATSSGGKFLYALNTFSDDVTIINSEDGSVLDKVPVGVSCRRIQLAPGGKYIYAYASKKVTLINTQTQKPTVHDLTSGHVNTVYADDANGRILALTTDSVLVFDAEKGNLEQTIGELHDPRFLVLPRSQTGL